MSDAGKVQLEEIRKALDELPYLKNLKVVDSGEEDRPWGIETVSGVPVASGMELYDAHLIANAPTWLRSLLEENTALRSELDKKNIVLQKVPELVYTDYPHTAAELCKIILSQYKEAEPSET